MTFSLKIFLYKIISSHFLYVMIIMEVCGPETGDDRQCMNSIIQGQLASVEFCDVVFELRALNFTTNACMGC